MRRRPPVKTVVFGGREIRSDDPMYRYLPKELLAESPLHVHSNSIESGCFRVYKCPECNSELYSAINESCACKCGQKSFVDYDGTVTPFEGELDYKAEPDAIKEFLLPSEVRDRKKQMADDFSSINKLCIFANGVTQTSIRNALSKRSKMKRNEISEDEPYNSGCLTALGVMILLSLILCATEDSPWVFVIAIVIAGLALWNEGRQHKELIARWEEDDRRLDGLMRCLYMHEAERLRDNFAARARWEARKKAEEDARRRREQKQKEEEEWLRKQRETELGLVKAICLGRIKFEEFVSNIRVGDGHGYERRVKKFIELCGFECEQVADGADQGVDLIVHDGDVSAAIQCKYYSDANAGNDAVQQVHAGAIFYSCGQCAVLTNNGFTKSARELAEKVGVELVLQDEIVKILDRLPSGKKKIDRLTDRDIVIPETIDPVCVESYKSMMRAVLDA